MRGDDSAGGKIPNGDNSQLHDDIHDLAETDPVLIDTVVAEKKFVAVGGKFLLVARLLGKGFDDFYAFDSFAQSGGDLIAGVATIMKEGN